MSSTPNFDRLARIYRWMELATFGNALGRCRCHYIDELRTCRRALVLGDGDGRFTARLLEINPEIQVDALDASAEMLRVLLERTRDHRARVQTWCGDIRAWQPSGTKYDLVVSHFFLDCLTAGEIGSLAVRVRSSLLPGARWLISEFAVPTNRFGKLVARPLVAGLYTAFGWLTGLGIRQLPDYPEALSSQGFKRMKYGPSLGGLLVTEVWSA